MSASWRFLRTSLLAAGLLAAASGCGGGSRHPQAATHPKPPAPLRPPRHFALRVIDADTGLPIPNPVVKVDGTVRHGGIRRGVETVALAAARSELLTVSAAHYGSKTLLVPARGSHGATVALYRPDGQWLMYGVNPARTQDQQAIALRPPFRIAWARNLGALLEFPAVVDDGVAYLSNALGELYALSMGSGKTLWQFDMHTSAEASSPAVDGTRLVAHSKGGRVLVLERATGRVLWSRATQGEIESSPVVEDGVDYLGDWSGHVYALNLASRRFDWVYDDGCKITASATIAGNALYIGDYCGRIVALDRSNGKLLWSASTGSPVYGASAFADGRVFVPSRDTGALDAFSSSGQPLWHVTTGDLVYSAPAVWDGRVYVGSYNGTLYCVSAATGSVLWDLPVGGRISGSATVVDGIVYVGDFSHRIVGADARSGHPLFNFPHGEYVAVSGNGGRLLLYGWATLWAVEAKR